MRQFDEAKKCYESLRELGEKSSADHHLKKVVETQEKLDICVYLVSFGIFENRKTSNIIERNRQNQQPSPAYNAYCMKQTI